MDWRQDAAGNLKLAASDYRNSSEYDFYAGPLDQNGATDKEVCDKWDTHFKVLGAEIDQHLVSYARAKAANEKMDCDSIPDGVKFWPAKGNPFFMKSINSNCRHLLTWHHFTIRMKMTSMTHATVIIL